ncbi:MAG: SDR family oxidoreductase [Rhodospirillales bacterium]|nr:SDR family oxidoreductase [Rhodospirillales bacterium]
MVRLEGKVAVVTGGSRGIGEAIARRLAAEGATVAITYAQSEEKARAVITDIEAAAGKGKGAGMAIKADSQDPAAVEAAIEAVSSAYGRIDILVNNAGIFDVRPIMELGLEDFDRTTDINVRAVFVAVRAAANHMPDNGRIITIGSNLAHRVPWPGFSLYAMSKAALIGLTKGLARDLGARKINVNLVHPGSTDTDMNPASGEMAETQRGLMAIERYNEPGDVAGLVAWLAGPEGRSVTGAEITMDNGTNI